MGILMPVDEFTGREPLKNQPVPAVEQVEDYKPMGTMETFYRANGWRWPPEELGPNGEYIAGCIK